MHCLHLAPLPFSRVSLPHARAVSVIELPGHKVDPMCAPLVALARSQSSAHSTLVDAWRSAWTASGRSPFFDAAMAGAGRRLRFVLAKAFAQL
eukprot:9481583-Pyramimonas_sp.AAC.1